MALRRNAQIVYYYLFFYLYKINEIVKIKSLMPIIKK